MILNQVGILGGGSGVVERWSFGELFVGGIVDWTCADRSFRLPMGAWSSKVTSGFPGVLGGDDFAGSRMGAAEWCYSCSGPLFGL